MHGSFIVEQCSKLYQNNTKKKSIWVTDYFGKYVHPNWNPSFKNPWRKRFKFLVNKLKFTNLVTWIWLKPPHDSDLPCWPCILQTLINYLRQTLLDFAFFKIDTKMKYSRFLLKSQNFGSWISSALSDISCL